MDIQELSKIVKNRRKELGISQADAAGLCGVGNRFFSELENGKESLHIGKVFLMLTMLGINVSLKTRD